MILGSQSPSYLRWVRPLLLALIILAALALTAAARFGTPAYLQFWTRPHRYLVRVLIDPVRNRSHAALLHVRRMRELWDADVENARLRLEISTVAASNQMLREEMSRMRRLTGLETWGGPPDVVLLPADVVGTDTYEGALLIVNRGEADGVRVGDAAVSLGGLVGKVRSVSTRSAQVQSLADAQSVVGAVGVGESGQRARGIVQGRGRNQPLQFIPENEVQPIEPGAVVISSGFNNSIFPKGLVIGVIESRSLDPNGLPIGVLRPSLPMSAVEEMLLVLPRERAKGAGITPVFTADALGTATLRALQEATSMTMDQRGATTRTIHLTMPAPAIRQWSAGSSATLELMLGQTLTSQVIAQFISTAVLTAAHSQRMATTETQAVEPTPAPAPEPPVPPIESFNESRKMEQRGEWPAEWQRGGGR